MEQSEKTFGERRRSVICANCKTQMVGMNKYAILKDNILVWYVCPRRKTNDEKGCGHMSPVELQKVADSEEGKLADSFLSGEVKSNDMSTMIIQDNLETFDTWLHRNREQFKDKKIEVTVRVIE